MSRLSKSALNRILEELPTYGLSKSKQETIKKLVEDEVERREGANRLKQFHDWIKKGDQIIQDFQEELERLKEVTDPEGDLISREAVLRILFEYHVENEHCEYEKGMNWVSGKVAEKIKGLPAISRI